MAFNEDCSYLDTFAIDDQNGEEGISKYELKIKPIVMKKVLVTGANGLLGSNVVLELLKKGFEVRALLRNSNSFLIPEQPELEVFIGDITNEELVRNALFGCHYVIHAAANTDMSLLHFEAYHKINVEGTLNVLKASLVNNVKRFVYVGTANSFETGSKKFPGDENQTIDVDEVKSFYSRSKTTAQNLVLSYADKMEVVVVNPTFMIGAYDTKPSSGKIIERALNKKIFFYPSGGKSFIHVADAAKATVSALELGNNGHNYLLSHENLSYRDFYKKLLLVNKQQSIMIKIPSFLLLISAYFGDIFRVFGMKTSISTANINLLIKENYYSNEKVKNEFDLQFKTTEQAIENYLDFRKKLK